MHIVKDKTNKKMRSYEWKEKAFVYHEKYIKQFVKKKTFVKKEEVLFRIRKYTILLNDDDAI